VAKYVCPIIRFAVLLEVKGHVGVRVRVRHPCEASHTVDSTYVQTGQAPVCSHSTGEMKLSKEWACTYGYLLYCTLEVVRL